MPQLVRERGAPVHLVQVQAHLYGLGPQVRRTVGAADRGGVRSVQQAVALLLDDPGQSVPQAVRCLPVQQLWPGPLR